MNDDVTVPRVSFIVRTKNRPNLLTEALHSIAGQTWPNLEIVIINDGGEDVGGVVEPLMPEVAAIKLLQLPESVGRSGAANAGLRQITGDWAGFLDDDDLLEAAHVRQLVDFALRHDAKVVYSGTKVVQVGQDRKHHEISEYNVPYSSERLLYENYLPIHSVLFHRSLLDGGVCFDADFDFFEDWDFWLQLSQKTAFMHLPMVSAIYRLHDNASGVHRHGAALIHYSRIYRKWLADHPLENIFSLLQRSHQWADERIAALQETNAKKLDEIGAKHSYAQGIVRERDAQLRELGDKHSYAQQIVKERDAQLRELNDKLDEIGRMHSHAQEIVRQRDAQLGERDTRARELAKAIAEKDSELDKIKNSAFWPAYRMFLK